MNYDEYLKSLGSNIAKYRKLKNIKQVDLAYKCEFEKSNMNRIEAGKSNVTIITLLKIATALELELKDLIDF